MKGPRGKLPKKKPKKKSMDFPSMNSMRSSTDLSKDSTIAHFGSVAFHLTCILQFFPQEFLG